MNELSKHHILGDPRIQRRGNVFAYPFRIPEKELIAIQSSAGISEHTKAWMTKGHWNGYVALHKNQVPREWRDGSYDHGGMQMLNIHGGITYCDVTTNYVIYGFDCNHAGDEENHDLYNPDNIFLMAEQMRKQLLALAKVWKQYKRMKMRNKVRLIDDIRARAKRKEEWSFAVNLGILAGSLPV